MTAKMRFLHRRAMNAPKDSGDLPGPRVRAVGLDDRLNLAALKGGSLHTLHKSDLEHILSRPVTLDADRRPILSIDDKRLIEIALEVRELIVNNPRLDKDGRERVIESMRRLGRRATREQFLRLARQTIIGEEAVADLVPWCNGPLQLQRAEGSMFHKMTSAWDSGEVCVPMIQGPNLLPKSFEGDPKIFVIQHDWASAFKGATDFAGGETRLPFEVCAFEYRISGRRVIANIYQVDGSGGCVMLFQTSTGTWVMPWYWTYDNGKLIPSSRDRSGEDAITKEFLQGSQRVADLIGENIRAVAISLEAEAAETEIVRAPHRLNRAREKAGKLPIYDYHVVSLARRSRPASLPRDPNAEPGTPKRLHFRRGHWRHYADHKTWLHWMLVGNPDLGFIDKHYKL